MILVTSGAARGDGFTCCAAIVGPGYGLPLRGYSMGAFSNWRIFINA